MPLSVTAALSAVQRVLIPDGAARGGRRSGDGLRARLVRAARPLAFAERRRGSVFAALCALAIFAVYFEDRRTAPGATVTALAFIPLIAAAWLLARRPLLVLLALAVSLDTLSCLAYGLSPVTALAQVSTVMLLVVVTRLAAVSVVLLLDSETRGAELAAAHRLTLDLEQAKSDFLRLASHEVRNPLMVLTGYVCLMDDGAFGEVPDRVREEVVPVLSAKIRDLTELADAMMETARLDDGRMELNLCELDLRQTVDAASSKVRELVGPLHRLVVEPAAGAVVVQGDSQRLLTVLVNLLGNAIKYSPDGGEIRCRLSTRGATASITVSDQGIGMNEQALSRLFGRFTRVAEGSDREIPGTGLGLYIARELARKHGGDITVTSAPRAGSTFTLTLPLATPVVRPAGVQAPESSGEMALQPF